MSAHGQAVRDQDVRVRTRRLGGGRVPVFQNLGKFLCAEFRSGLKAQSGSMIWRSRFGSVPQGASGRSEEPRSPPSKTGLFRTVYPLGREGLIERAGAQAFGRSAPFPSYRESVKGGRVGENF